MSFRHFDVIMQRSYTEFERFADELARLRGRMRALFTEVRSATGLGEMELTVLTATVNAVRPPTVAQIGRSLGHPRQVVQRAANRLAELGLVTFAPNPDHKRASILIATQAGVRLKAEDHVRASAVTDAVLNRITADEFAEVATRLASIRAGIEGYLRERENDPGV
jgi:DNA-binding MarR family transcriptional regulator